MAKNKDIKSTTLISKKPFSKFQQDMLKEHNEYRKRHGVPELKLNTKLCKFAQEWANNCANTSTMKHRQNCPYGENIFYAYSNDPNFVQSAERVVKDWYDEIKEFSFQETINPNTLHFTQVIWKNSVEVGVGIAKNNKGKVYVVANYDPKGNIQGKFVENVPRPKLLQKSSFNQKIQPPIL